jgi:large subunit ribosomal protein L31
LKKSIHPELTRATIRCTSCGSTLELRSARPKPTVDICANCHPAYTGRERRATSGGRIERFERRRGLVASRRERKELR